MDYFRLAGVPYNSLMDKAIEAILSKRTPEDEWKLSSHYPGKVHFVKEQAGKPSRWNTFRVMRMLKYASISKNHPARN